MTELREHWPEIQKLLRASLSEVSAELDSKTIEAVTDFLDQNELELALRWMRSAAEEHKIKFSGIVARDLKRAAFLMRIDL